MRAPSQPTPDAGPSADELLDWRRGIDTGNWIHFNAAGASPAHHSCHKAQTDHLQLERSMGGYAAAAAAAAAGDDARSVIGALLNCDASELALQESAQLGWAKAFYSLDLRPADTIVAFESEYAGNAVAMLQQHKRTGAALCVLPLRPSGLVNLDALRTALRTARQAGGRCVVALTHMNTDSALLQPAAAVGALAREHGAVFLLDACQTIGQLPVDVAAIGCDFACGTGRKWLRGPRGSGFLYARRGATELADARSGSLFGEPPMLDHVSGRWLSRHRYALAAGARRFEMWEASEASRLGLAAAARLALSVTPARINSLSAARASRLRRVLRERVAGLRLRDGSELAPEGGHGLGAIVAFHLDGVDAHALAAALGARRIGCSVAPSTHSFCEAEWARPPALRLSPSYFNTPEEVEAVAAAVAEEADALRNATSVAGPLR